MRTWLILFIALPLFAQSISELELLADQIIYPTQGAVVNMDSLWVTTMAEKLALEKGAGRWGNVPTQFVFERGLFIVTGDWYPCPIVPFSVDAMGNPMFKNPGKVYYDVYDLSDYPPTWVRSDSAVNSNVNLHSVFRTLKNQNRLARIIRNRYRPK